VATEQTIDVYLALHIREKRLPFQTCLNDTGPKESPPNPLILPSISSFLAQWSGSNGRVLYGTHWYSLIAQAKEQHPVYFAIIHTLCLFLHEKAADAYMMKYPD
jgi:hypothetical protein